MMEELKLIIDISQNTSSLAIWMYAGYLAKDFILALIFMGVFYKVGKWAFDNRDTV